MNEHTTTIFFLKVIMNLKLGSRVRRLGGEEESNKSRRRRRRSNNNNRLTWLSFIVSFRKVLLVVFLVYNNNTTTTNAFCGTATTATTATTTTTIASRRLLLLLRRRRWRGYNYKNHHNSHHYHDHHYHNNNYDEHNYYYTTHLLLSSSSSSSSTATTATNLLENQQQQNQQQQHPSQSQSQSQSPEQLQGGEESLQQQQQQQSQKSSSSTSTTTSTQSSSSYSDGSDTLERFRNDVKTVVQVLRPSHEEDSTIPALFRRRKPSFTSIWDKEDWEIHTSRKRYIRYIIEFPTSRLLHRVFPQMILLFLWTCFSICISMYGNSFGWNTTTGAATAATAAATTIGATTKIQNTIGLTTPAMSLISTFVAALLTLRSNQGLSRLTEARNAFGQVVLLTREMSQLISTSIYPNHPQMGLLAARHVAIFGWSLKAHVRGEEQHSNQDIICTMLPHSVDATFVNNFSRKQPAAIIIRLRQIFEYLSTQSSNPVDKEVQKILLQTTSKLNEVLMITEKIRNTPIPPLYTAHTTRLLVFYLFWLPLALYDGTSTILGRKSISTVTSTILVTLAAGYAMLGLDEISHLLELPFKLMPLRELSKMSMIDSADAMVYRPPPLNTCSASTVGTIDSPSSSSSSSSPPPPPSPPSIMEHW